MSVAFRSALLAGCLAALFPLAPAHAEDAGADASPKTGPVTGRALPRFVSLKSRSVNMRVGPGVKYPIAWRYGRPGLPVEIIGEHGNWRQIRDADNAEGWVLHSLVVGRRTALVAPWSAGSKDGEGGIAKLVLADAAPLLEGRAGPSRDEATVARFQAGLVVKVAACDTKWCAVEAKGRRAWLPQSALWGVYRGETIED